MLPMKRIIFDADLTMGVPNCDVDDGLAILFALGYLKENPGSCELLGLCTSYGNSTLETVYETAHQVWEDIGIAAPILKGASNSKTPISEAAHFLVEQANAYPGEISLSVTGSTTNLQGALLLDETVLSKFREIVFMGGITQSLVFNGKIMNELNFSCDPQATCNALAAANNGANIVVMTAQNCLPAHFMPDEFERKLTTNEADGGYLCRTCTPWFDTMKRKYQLDGFCCWDVLTSAYILERKLFEDESFNVSLNPKLLEAGFLENAPAGAPSAKINTPRIENAATFCARVYELWRKAL